MRKLIPVLGAAVLSVAVLLSSLYNVFHAGKSNDMLPAGEIPSQITNVSREGIAQYAYINGFVSKVTDGDTISVVYKNKTYKVRLLYIDTPESVKSGVAVQEYAKKAAKATRDLVLNKEVKLVFEKGLKDKYGRLLAHVFLKNGGYLNGMLVRNGFARVEVVSPNSAFSEYFYKLQDKAIEEKMGLWSLPGDKQPFVKNENGEFIPRYWSGQEAS